MLPVPSRARILEGLSIVLAVNIRSLPALQARSWASPIGAKDRTPSSNGKEIIGPADLAALGLEFGPTPRGPACPHRSCFDPHFVRHPASAGVCCLRQNSDGVFIVKHGSGAAPVAGRARSIISIRFRVA